MGQNCPVNIGFEKANFENWSCESGFISTDGQISLFATEPIPERHDIIAATSYLVSDPYGDFPVNSPNGSGHSVRIGSTSTGTLADRISYTFTVPADQMEFSIIYNYAVVFYNPQEDHADFEQPKFTARAFDVSANQYIECGSFDFVSSSALPGFAQSAVNRDVYYKPWAPITLNLTGFAGKTIRLELTVNGCTKNNGRHFGYAYIDVNENCDSPISGNVICDPASPITLAAPGGFKEYSWYNTSDMSKILGTGNTLTISPAPPAGTKYAVRIIPFPGLGCAATLYTTTRQGDALLNFNVADRMETCYPGSVDLRTAISDNLPGLTYTYFTDREATTFVRFPNAVIESGTYFIKATNATGCYMIKPVVVQINTVDLIINNPPPACFPGTVDLTDQSVTSGSEPELILSYYRDANAASELTDPDKVDATGTYYIKAVNPLGCIIIKPVSVIIATLVTNNQAACKSVNLTGSAVTAGSTRLFDFSYWQDEQATISLPDPRAVTTSGTYYIKGTTSGCSKIVPVEVTVYALPVKNFNDPPPVTYPQTVNMTVADPFPAGLTYSYWQDPRATIQLSNPDAISVTGTYYLRIENEQGCSAIFPVNVTINEPPVPKVITHNTFTPNSDGVNDYFTLQMDGTLRINYFRIYNRWGQLIFSTRQISNSWDGTLNGKIQPAGTYYWMLDGIDDYRKRKVTQSGSITLLR